MIEGYNPEKILDGDKLREKLEAILPGAQRKVVFISAYITQPGFDWFDEHTPTNIDKHIICRLLPSDVIFGSTHLSALKAALEAGIKVSCLHSLHAKIYSIDDETIFIGSANLTKNGLKIHGAGNLEACLKTTMSPENSEFIANIIKSSSPLRLETIESMQGFIDNQKSNVDIDEWPESILAENEGIWVHDFFWTLPEAILDSLERKHDCEILGINSLTIDQNALRQKVRHSRCVRWLIKVLKQSPEQELYFGNLSQILHDELKDDPSPYRKDIKGLLQNLLAYCEQYLPDEIEVTRPNYSQRVKLLMAS